MCDVGTEDESGLCASLRRQLQRGQPRRFKARKINRSYLSEQYNIELLGVTIWFSHTVLGLPRSAQCVLSRLSAAQGVKGCSPELQETGRHVVNVVKLGLQFNGHPLPLCAIARSDAFKRRPGRAFAVGCGRVRAARLLRRGRVGS